MYKLSCVDLRVDDDESRNDKETIVDTSDIAKSFDESDLDDWIRDINDGAEKAREFTMRGRRASNKATPSKTTMRAPTRASMPRGFVCNF